MLARMVAFYVEASQPEEAGSPPHQAVTARPRSVSASVMLAEFLQKQKRFEEAEEAYRQALDVQPDSPVILNSLAYMNGRAS
jgi:Flp pilus assembly protein TadD